MGSADVGGGRVRGGQKRRRGQSVQAWLCGAELDPTPGLGLASSHPLHLVVVDLVEAIGAGLAGPWALVICSEVRDHRTSVNKPRSKGEVSIEAKI